MGSGRDPGRPTGAEMLARLERAPRDSGSRGELRVYLGFAPGVGKTYAMLRDAHQLRATGVDVVGGFIETHGRAETADQIGDLEVIPRATVTYREVALEEMDVDAVVRRQPRVCLVDELAHTNVPGSPRQKRWQDVQFLRGAGINVWTTLNIQHLEGLNDVIESTSGVAVRETVPDHLLDDPTIVHFVDLPPELLRERLYEGKIYSGDTARRALEHFFQASNLTALRQIALRQMAAGVETTLEQYMNDEETAGSRANVDVVLACIGSGASAARVLRTAWRLAGALDAPLIAVHVNHEHSVVRDEMFGAALELAVDLGAEVITRSGEDIVEAVLAVAKARNATLVVIANTPHSRWQELRRRVLAYELIRQTRGMDVYVVDAPFR